MNISNFIIRIVFLVLPGVICSYLYRELRGKTSKKDWEDYLEILVFSLSSYGIYGLGVDLFRYLGWTSAQFTAFNAFSDDRVPISWREIIVASVISVALSFVASAIYTHNLISKFGQLIGVTRRFGAEDVWIFFHNVPDVDWVFVRDHKLNLSYYCWIRAYSDADKERELLLRDVEVYSNSSGELLYKTNAIYLSRKRDDLTIEVPTVIN